jgi:regulator of protease activity HflC (stomatin/prohibitin superfamily)
MTPFFIILAVFVIILAARGLLIVKQSETIVVERLGRFHRTLDSGINVI